MAKKRKNAFMRYLTPFGLRQVGDISMFVAAIVLIVGFCMYEITNVVAIVGLCLFMLGSLIALFRSIAILVSGRSRRSPEFKHALVNTVIAGIFIVLTVIGLLSAFGIIG